MESIPYIEMGLTLFLYFSDAVLNCAGAFLYVTFALTLLYFAPSVRAAIVVRALGHEAKK